MDQCKALPLPATDVTKAGTMGTDQAVEIGSTSETVETTVETVDGTEAVQC